MSDWKEDAIRHKYAPIPDEPRHKKKAKKRHVRSDHRHEYEVVCLDEGSCILSHGRKIPHMRLVERCKLCGRIGDGHGYVSEPPKGMCLFRTNGLMVPREKYLPESKEVIQ